MPTALHSNALVPRANPIQNAGLTLTVLKPASGHSPMTRSYDVRSTGVHIWSRVFGTGLIRSSFPAMSKCKLFLSTGSFLLVFRETLCQRAMIYQERDLPCHVTNLPYLEHNAYFHKIVYSYWANRWWSRWDTTDDAVESVHSVEFLLHYNVDSFCASEIVT
jgi:hypothetical protein